MAGADQLFGGPQGGSTELDKTGYKYNYKEMRMTMQIASLSAGVDSPWGTGIGLLLPYAWLRYEDWNTDRNKKPQVSDALGDTEIRLRQNVLQPFKLKPLSGTYQLPRFFLTAGVVLPNRSAYSTNTVKDLSISRGANWLIAELEIQQELPQNFGLSLTGGYRTALNYASTPDSDPSIGLGWGDEFRSALSARYLLDLPVVEGVGNYFVPKRLLLLVNGEFLHRNKSTVVENLDVGRQPYPDSGGQTVSLTPTFMVGYNDNWSVTASARVPLYRYVNGEQPVQSTSYFFGLNWSWSSTPPKPELGKLAEIGQGPTTPDIEKLLVPGKYTLIDYWATWCEPCGRLGVKLENELPSRPGVVLARVDATAWEAEEWNKFLPGAPGIPVLDLYDRAGKLLVRLQGDDCFGYAAHLPADASEATAP